MVESSARLHVAGDVGGQRLAFRSDPVYNRPLHPLGVIGPSTVRTLLNLLAHNKFILDANGSSAKKRTRSAIAITSSSDVTIWLIVLRFLLISLSYRGAHLIVSVYLI